MSAASELEPGRAGKTYCRVAAQGLRVSRGVAQIWIACITGAWEGSQPLEVLLVYEGRAHPRAERLRLARAFLNF